MKFHSIIQTALCCTAVLFAGTPLSANNGDYGLNSPDGHITVNVAVGSDIKYSISRDGKVLIAPSVISMNLSDGIAFGENDKLRKVNRSSYDETCPATAYKKAEVRDNYNQISVQIVKHLSHTLSVSAASSLTVNSTVHLKTPIPFRTFPDGERTSWRFCLLLSKRTME